MAKTSQAAEVLKYLQAYGSITSWEAIKEFGATRLSAIIFNLRKEGHPIISEDVHDRNRFGNPVTYARYIYVKNKDGQLQLF